MAERTPGTVIVWVLAGLLAAFALWRIAAGSDLGGGAGAAAGVPLRVERPGGSERRARASIYVHVAGAVAQPGLVRVRADARAAEAVTRAGGLTPRADVAGVNLAAKLEDGQQVIVPLRGAVPGAVAAGSGGGEPGSPGVPKLSLATASIEQLDELDGIGPTLAERILEYRTENGGFRSLAELREVEGIGEKRFASLSEAVQL